MMDVINPKRLEDLFPVFDRAARDERIVLSTTGGSELDDALSEPEPDGGALGICSSGTTGKPKCVWVRWADLVSQASPSDAVRGWHWASPFSPVTFAGVQVGLQAWLSGGRITQLDNDWDKAWRVLMKERVDALCCTPTYLDLLLQNENENENEGDPDAGVAWQVKQITLGGEPVRPGVVRRAKLRFPKGRVTSIYASTELGVLMKTRREDGWYEKQSLSDRFPEWRVEAGQLEVRRQGRWIRTGDLVEIEGDLMRVIGRADQVANVAGAKVNLGEVSALAEQVRGVRKAAAIAESNPVVGQIVCLHYAQEPGYTEQDVRSDMEELFRRRLCKEAWPRRWQVGEVGVGANWKGKVC